MKNFKSYINELLYAIGMLTMSISLFLKDLDSLIFTGFTFVILYLIIISKRLEISNEIEEEKLNLITKLTEKE